MIEPSAREGGWNQTEMRPFYDINSMEGRAICYIGMKPHAFRVKKGFRIN